MLKYTKKPKHAHSNTLKSASPHRLSRVLFTSTSGGAQHVRKAGPKQDKASFPISPMNSTELKVVFGQIASLFWTCFWNFLSFCLFLYHLWQNGKDCPVTSVKTLINPEDYTSSTKSPNFFYLIFLYTSQRKQWLASALLWNRTGP